MRSSDTPANDLEPTGQQGPADWSRETPSDDQLSLAVRERLVLAELVRLERHVDELEANVDRLSRAAGVELDGPGDEP